VYGVQRQRPDRRLELPYLRLDQVEDAVAAQWYREVFPPELIAALREQLTSRTAVLAALQEHRKPDGLAEVVDQEQKRRQESPDGVDHVSVSNNEQMSGAKGTRTPDLLVAKVAPGEGLRALRTPLGALCAS